MADLAVAEEEPTSQPAARSWKERNRWLWVPIFAFLVTRLILALPIYLSFQEIPDNRFIEPYHVWPTNLVIDTLGGRWDTGFYLNIAQEGYHYFAEDVVFPSVAFFPALSTLMVLFAPLFGGHVILSGLFVTNLALLAASVLLYRLTALEFGDATAGRSVWYLLIFPTSLFGSAIYTESLFLLCAVGAFFAARRGHWGWATLFSALSSATRLMGIILLPALLVEWWQQRQRPTLTERPPRWAVIAPLAAPLGLLAYMAFLGWQFGDPFGFYRASAVWQRSPQPMWEMVQELFVAPAVGWRVALATATFAVNDWIDFLFAGFFLILGLIILWQRRWSEGVFVLFGVLLPLNSGLWASQRRYVWVLFPVFILLARWGKSSTVDRLITGVFLVLLSYFAMLYANWYWVA